MKVADNSILSSPDNMMRFRIMRSIDRPLDKLTVKDICAAASISRDTFYRYFSSKYDIPVWHGKFVQSLYLDEAGRTIDLKTGYYHDFRLLAQEKEFYKNALRNFGRTIQEFPEMIAHRKEVLRDTIGEWNHIPITNEMEFCIDAYASLETLLVTRWLRDECQTSPEVFAEYMLSVVPRKIYKALDHRERKQG